MRASPLCHYDSFTSLRGNVASLFAPLKSPESVRREVHQYVCHVPWRYKGVPRQRGSWMRGTLNLVFGEARRRGSYTVARAAVEVALAQQQQLQLTIEPSWVKNALAACRTAEEMREMETLLARHRRLVGGGVGEAGHELTSATQRDDALLPQSLQDDVGEPRDTTLLAAGYSNVVLATLRQKRDHVVAAPNASFSRYFVRQGLVEDEAELMELFKALRGRQPVGFRVLTSQMYGKVVEGLLRGRPGIEPLSWLPPMCGAFVMSDTPDIPHNILLSNRQLLRALANERLISFQSTSSMLPVLLLDPRPGESVLDLCASPGNKAALILDYMTGLSSSSVLSSESGCIVANDAIFSRRHALAQRLQSVSPNIAVTQIQGQHFPVQPVATGGVQYDKVLVDAPCSGEGRMHKDVMSWRMWHPLKAVEFFATQVALLRRAVELCAAGGCIVYSTCTLNPLENEAVVSTVLADGGVELVRPPRSMTANSGWHFGRGLPRWLVPSRAGGFLHTFAEAEAKGEKTTVELFPPDGNAKVQAALEACCLRVLPHRNGGAEGFFLAALRKVRHGNSARFLSPPPKVTVSGETAAISGGQLVGDSVLHACGVVRLSPGNMLLRQHLGVFFNDSATQMEAFLTKCGLCAAWRENRGLLLISESSWAHMRAISSTTVMPSLSSPSSAAALLEVGIVVIDAATGGLTESGAFYLRPHATSRVLPIPFSEMQWLLSHQVLKLSELQEDPKLVARRIVGNMTRLNEEAEMAQCQTPLQWVAHAFAVIGSREGNFIVSCLPPSAPTELHTDVHAAGLASLSIPVLLRRSSAGVELHLSLSQDARQRCLAVIGRVLAHNRRTGATAAAAAALEQEHMQMGVQYNTSRTMDSAGLEGRPLTAQRQHRRLYLSTSFVPSTSSPPLHTVAATSPTGAPHNDSIRRVGANDGENQKYLRPARCFEI
ncbi:tRNA (cytosine34-C5)-methyltransferase [Trypanosoma rangeli]|uniref:tRNA (Cytosine34-C5)-methyltransferase n=1 Tax=Trypanosoma rangeli TaxID=5698 RepID=A0A3R7KIK0_TRYRA|nr:tRNA (cytosine34-C5)-methyltransferase [Trypanosoma rangeli]RNF08293.1 tRNA (cytosine34-C5)-methyltransferase [Trypanosoma rangeli]|eukprot:RNF08293.1 tRNA (cytosine34-C5)-methyltransferase [Trypanosoma rangeli]